MNNSPTCCQDLRFLRGIEGSTGWCGRSQRCNTGGKGRLRTTPCEGQVPASKQAAHDVIEWPRDSRSYLELLTLPLVHEYLGTESSRKAVAIVLSLRLDRKHSLHQRISADSLTVHCVFVSKYHSPFDRWDRCNIVPSQSAFLLTQT